MVSGSAERETHFLCEIQEFVQPKNNKFTAEQGSLQLCFSSSPAVIFIIRQL